MQRIVPLVTDDRVLQRTPLNFDPSVWELFAPLLAGACLVVCPPGQLRHWAELVPVIHGSRITVLQVVPSLLGMLMTEPGFNRCTSLRQVLCGGEILPVDLKDKLLASGSMVLINLYGPTETTINSTFHLCCDQPGQTSVPIGRPLDNTEVFVLDREMRLLPCGVPGELYIGGADLARGYFGCDELTAERFLPHPFSDTPGARVYKTGDRVRWRPDGQLEFLGRLDHQVKLRGFRIDLGEIESVLAGHPDLAGAVVLLRERDTGPQLAAYVVPQAGRDVPMAELRRFLRERLPEHMMPSAWSALTGWPLTPNGKLDREALPPPQPESRSDFVAPRTAVEQALAALWTDVLELDQVGLFDNFFEVGGHSLLAVQLVSRIRETLRVDVPVRSLFENPSIAGLRDLLLGDDTRAAQVEKVAGLLQELNALSDTEIDAMLAERSGATSTSESLP